MGRSLCVPCSLSDEYSEYKPVHGSIYDVRKKNDSDEREENDHSSSDKIVRREVLKQVGAAASIGTFGLGTMGQASADTSSDSTVTVEPVDSSQRRRKIRGEIFSNQKFRQRLQNLKSMGHIPRIDDLEIGEMFAPNASSPGLIAARIPFKTDKEGLEIHLEWFREEGDEEIKTRLEGPVKTQPELFNALEKDSEYQNEIKQLEEKGYEINTKAASAVRYRKAEGDQAVVQVVPDSVDLSSHTSKEIASGKAPIVVSEVILDSSEEQIETQGTKDCVINCSGGESSLFGCAAFAGTCLEGSITGCLAAATCSCLVGCCLGECIQGSFACDFALGGCVFPFPPGAGPTECCIAAGCVDFFNCDINL
jgi:hypothetical protein